MATCYQCGKPLILKDGKCLNCGMDPSLEFIPQTPEEDRRPSCEDIPKAIDDLKIMVTRRGSDDIGAILTQLGVKYYPFSGDYDCDILFLNCLTSDSINPGKLRSFVRQGGILYASDLASFKLFAAWPTMMLVINTTNPCIVPASIVDPDLQKYLGTKMDINFDMPGWSKVVLAPRGKVLMRSLKGGFPIMLEFSLGKGKVFYTSFHNHAQAAESEQTLIKLLVVKNFSSAANLDFQKTWEYLRERFK